MINVMQLVQHFTVIGGLEKMVVELSRKSAHRQSTHLVSLSDKHSDLAECWPDLYHNAHVTCLNKPDGIQWSVVKQLVEHIDQHQIDVIHSHHIGPMLYAAMAIKQRPHVKHITTIHDAWYLQQWRYRLMTWALCKFTAMNVVADAQAVAQEVKRKVHHSAEQVIINGIDSVQFSPINQQYARFQLGLPNHARIVGCGARLEPGKGHQDIIAHLTQLPQDVHVAFAGEGSLKAELIHMTDQLGLSKRVHWLGMVQEMEVFYSAIDVFCLFSQREGLPLTLLEALACNTPVVASNVGGISEIVDQQAGILIAPDRADLLPESLEQAFVLKQSKTIRANNLTQVCSSLMAKRYDALYRALVV